MRIGSAVRTGSRVNGGGSLPPFFTRSITIGFHRRSTAMSHVWNIFHRHRNVRSTLRLLHTVLVVCRKTARFATNFARHTFGRIFCGHSNAKIKVHSINFGSTQGWQVAAFLILFSVGQRFGGWWDYGKQTARMGAAPGGRVSKVANIDAISVY